MEQTTTRAALTRLAAGLAGAAVVAALAATWAGIVLADGYRPPAEGPVPAEIAPAVDRSGSWTDWHGRATVLLVVVTAGTAGLAGWLRYGTAHLRTGRPRRRSLVGAVVAVVAAIAVLATRGMVQWDALGLRAVTTPAGLGDLSGYWPAAFDDGTVRFVLVGSGEVSQDRYAATLLLHLGAPIVAAVASLVTAWGLLPALRLRATPDAGRGR